MKKKAAALLPVIIILFSQFVFMPSAYGSEPQRMGSSSAYYNYDSESRTLTIEGKGDTPNYSDWYNIPWREDVNNIEHIVVRDGITKIGNYTFYGFASCKDVKLPSTLTQIGKNAFAYSGFKEINLPEKLTLIDNKAFYSCSLTKVEIPASVSVIGKQAFEASEKLADVEFNIECKCEILDFAFAACPELKSVNVPSQVSMGNHCYGFKQNHTELIDGELTIYGFHLSSAHTYALANGINFVDVETLTTSLQLGETAMAEIYSEKSVMHFAFTPQYTTEYRFFSTGATDVKAVLYDEYNNKIAENDDCNPPYDYNFDIIYRCEAGKTYSLEVMGVGATGCFGICVLPVNIMSVSAEFVPELSFIEYIDAKERDGKKYYDYSGMLKNLRLTVVYDTGFTANAIAFDGEFAHIKITVSDEQTEKPWSIEGENYVTVKYSGFTCNAAVILKEHTHQYTAQVTEPTLEKQGYTVYTCVWCGASYISDYTERLGREISGSVILLESPSGESKSNIPVSGVEIYVDGKFAALTESDGRYSFIVSREDIELTFVPPYGPERKVSVVGGGDTDIEKTAVVGFDFNKDGYINARDLSRLLYMARNGKAEGLDYNSDGVVNSEDFTLSKSFLTVRADENIYN